MSEMDALKGASLRKLEARAGVRTTCYCSKGCRKRASECQVESRRGERASERVSAALETVEGEGDEARARESAFPSSAQLFAVAEESRSALSDFFQRAL